MTRHEETKLLPYQPDQLYALVADIESYPEFLPWCQAARIRTRTKYEGYELVEADLIIAFMAFRERFGSKVKLEPDAWVITVDYLDGPFRSLKNHWQFHPSEAGGTKLEFYVEFEFKSRILEAVIGRVFDQAMRKIVTAFEERARTLYGA